MKRTLGALAALLCILVALTGDAIDWTFKDNVVVQQNVRVQQNLSVDGMLKVKAGPWVDVTTYGATLGAGQSTAVKNANAVAVQAAYDNVKGSGGTVLIPGVVEVGANVLNFGDSSAHWVNISVVGLGYDQSQIVSESTTNVIDLVGRNYLTIKDLKITSTTAQVGILMGRTAASPNCSGNRLVAVKVDGQFSKAALVTIASEILVVEDSYFRNLSGTNLAYFSSTTNATIGATSTNGTITTSSNTDIHFRGSQFTNWNDNASVVKLENAWSGSFESCGFTGGASTGVNLVTLTSVAGTNIFRGPMVIRDSLFEGGGGYQVYFKSTGSLTTFVGLVFDGNYFNNYGSVTPTYAQPFGYDNTALTAVYELSVKNNRVNPYLDNSAVRLAQTVDSEITNFSEYGEVIVLSGGYLFNCLVRASTVTYQGTGFAIGSIIGTKDGVAGTMRYVYGPQPTSSSGAIGGGTQARGSMFQLFPQEAPSITLGEGMIATAGGTVWSPALNTFPATVTNLGNYPVFYTGSKWVPMIPVATTPASATAACIKGAIAFDNAYVYVCAADNVWRRAAIAGGW